MCLGRTVRASQWMRIGYGKGRKKWWTETLMRSCPKLREHYASIVCVIKSGTTMSANILDVLNVFSMVGEEVSGARCALLDIENIFLDVAAVRSKFAKTVAAIESSLKATMSSLRVACRYRICGNKIFKGQLPGQ
jgi:hypothetical protein